MGCSYDLLVLDAPPRQLAVLDKWCGERDVRVMRGSRRTLHSVPVDDVDGCVAFLSRVSDAPCVLAMRDRLGDFAWLFMTEDDSPELAIELAHSGVRVGSQSATEEDVATRALALLARSRSVSSRSARARRVWLSPAMRRLAPSITSASRSRSNVLLLGARGSGRSFLARCIDEAGGRGSRMRVVGGVEELRRTLDRAGGSVLLEDLQDLADAEQRAILHETRTSRHRIFATGARSASGIRPDLRAAFRTIDVPSAAERRLDVPVIARVELDRCAGGYETLPVALTAERVSELEQLAHREGLRALVRQLEHVALEGGFGRSHDIRKG